MKFFIAFLLASFILGSSRRLAPIRDRWYLVLAGVVVYAAAFYSLKVVG